MIFKDPVLIGLILGAVFSIVIFAVVMCTQYWTLYKDYRSCKNSNIKRGGGVSKLVSKNENDKQH